MEDKIIKINIENEMKTSYLNYAMSVIVSRALPDVRDGLKPVHRRILFGMHEMGLRSNKPYKKAARIVGDVLGKYHPHGDQSVYDALVRLAQDFSLRYTVVDPQGNFGSIDGDPAAAMRYTEARLSKIGEQMLVDIEKETVDYGPNYDDSMSEPTVLPAAIPFLLANGASGIAVGMATNLAPHNLIEICDAISAYIDNFDISIEELMNYIKGPDFPTKGMICGTKGIKDAFLTGRGKIIMRGRYDIEELKNGNDAIVFTELPYQVNKADLVTKIDDLRKSILPQISVVRDESDRDGIRVVIELKRGAVTNVVVNHLFKRTPLQSNFNVNNLALVKGKPELLNLKDLIRYYVDHREEVVTRRIQYDLRKAKERAHILEGLKIGIDNVDEIVEMSKKAKDIPTLVIQLCKRFGLSEIQAQAIVDMKLGRLTGLEFDKILEELKALMIKIAEYEDLLANRDKLLALIKSELNEVSYKYDNKRQTEIIEEEIGEMKDEDFIKEEEVVVVVSNKGFVKRVPLEEYKTQNRGGVGVRGASLRDEDFVEHLFVGNTHDYVMFITNQGKGYWTKVHELPVGSKTTKGVSIKTLLQVQDDEKITTIIDFNEFREDQYVIMATNYGYIKKTVLSAFRNARVRGIIATRLEEGEFLVSSILIKDEDEVMAVSENGKGLRFLADQIRSMGRNSRGVIGLRLSSDDKLAGLVKVDEEKRILMVTTQGNGKQVKYSEFMPHNRATMGQRILKFKKKGETIIGVLSVDNDKDLVAITSKGQIIRTPVESISIQGRNATGVKVVNMRKGDTIVSTAITEKEEVDEEIVDSEE